MNQVDLRGGVLQRPQQQRKGPEAGLRSWCSGMLQGPRVTGAGQQEGAGDMVVAAALRGPPGARQCPTCSQAHLFSRQPTREGLLPLICC